MGFAAVNPATGGVIRRYPMMDPGTVDEIVARVHAETEAWGDVGFEDRAKPMREAARILRERAREWGELMTLEMGKPVRAGVAEAEKCAWACEYFADKAETFLAPVIVETDAARSYWTHRPLGVVLAIMPWNFPFWQVFRFAAPALMAGNGVLMKHAPNVPGCALAIEGIFRDAGFPEHLLRALFIEDAEAGDLIEDPRVRALTLTGSVRAGKAVAARAGSVVKKTVLELGGSDPYVVLADADVEAAATTCVASRLVNSGQSCIAAKRLIAVGDVYDVFRDAVVSLMRQVELGDPMEEGTTLGPMAREDLRDHLHAQVRKSVQAGATCVLGGEVPDRSGWWYPATVLEDVGPGMPAWEEEIFGPVAVLIRARDEEDALRIANDTSFGLGAAVFTRDAARGEAIARDRLRAGVCFVNGLVRSDPRLPFGGIGESGYGRELSPLGIREFVNAKTVWVE
jgi:succinate-semialdehyde dehydrogenase/glutarate-semialdehyde dehydrogenase